MNKQLLKIYLIALAVLITSFINAEDLLNDGRLMNAIRMESIQQPAVILDVNALTVYGDKNRIEKSGNLIRFAGEAAWQLANVKEAEYYIGLKLRFITDGSQYGDSNLMRYLISPELFLNGKLINFATCGSPIMDSSTGWMVVELRTNKALVLKDGDELRLAGKSSGKWFGSLALYKSKPDDGPIDISYHTILADNASGLIKSIDMDILNLQADFEMAKTFGAESTINLAVQNVGGKSRNVKVEWKLLDYFQKVILEGEDDAEIQNRDYWRKKLVFTPGDSDRYRLILSTTDDDGNVLETVSEVLTDAKLNEFRGKVWLNDGWLLSKLNTGIAELEASPVADAKWEKTREFPTYLTKGSRWVADGVNCAWIKRTIEVPEWMPGERYYLHFDQIAYEASVYIDGDFVGEHWGPLDPFDIDISKWVKKGEKFEVLVGMRNHVAGIADTEWKKKRPGIGGRADLIAPPGYHGNDISVGEISLNSTPIKRIENVYVKTSYQKKTLSAFVKSEEYTKGVKFSFNVYYNGKYVLTMPDLTLENKQDGFVSTSTNWLKPILWDIKQPNLLMLKTEAFDQAGVRIDEYDLRFGFKELWFADRFVFMNGRKIKFKSCAMNGGDWGMVSRMPRSHIRTRFREQLYDIKSDFLIGVVARPSQLDIADEEGLLLTQSITGSYHPTSYMVESDAFWSNCTAFAVSTFKATRNHPCIYNYRIGGEYSEHAGDPVGKKTKRLQRMGEALQAIEPDIVLESACDLDLRGWLPSISTHYPEGSVLRTVDNYLPNAIIWRPFDKEFFPGMKVPQGVNNTTCNVMGESPITWGMKPILVHETGWYYFFRPPYGLAGLFGDWVYRGPQAQKEAHILANEWFMAGHRDAEVSLITPWDHFREKAIPRVIPAIDVFPLSRHTRWYSNTPVNWQMNIHNDVYVSNVLTLTIDLSYGDKNITLLDKKYSMKPAGLERVSLDFNCPVVKEIRAGIMVLRLTDQNGEVVRQRTFSVGLYPELNPQKEYAHIAIFDKKQQSYKALRNAGYSLKRITVINDTELDNIKVLIIGEENGPELDKYGEAILKFVKLGGSVLVLNQEKLGNKWLPMPLDTSKKITSIMFNRAPHHPITKGLTNDDLKFWFPSHITAKYDIVKPVKGNFCAILDSGSGINGLNYTPLLEVQYGKGCYIFNQLLFSELLSKSPVADYIFNNTISYLMNRQAPSSRKTALIAEKGSQLDTALNKLGLDYEIFAQGNSNQYDLVIVDASVATTMTPIIKDLLAKGKKVLLHGAIPESASWMSDLCGKEVTVGKTNLSKMFYGRFVRRFSDPIIDGLNNEDFYWRMPATSESYWSLFYEDHYLMGEVSDWVVKVKDVNPVTFPEVLTVMPVGKGTLIFDNVIWDHPTSASERLATRYASMLISNLGGTFSKVNYKAWQDKLNYKSIDLRQYANRSFVDEVKDDGKGGWTDQGAKNDLRNFKTGTQSWHGVPFTTYDDKSCIVLKSSATVPGPPEKVEGIIVNQYADACYFLQTSWVTRNGKAASYIINYADGTQELIDLVRGINYRDSDTWYGGKPFPMEISTYTRRAWRGKNEHCGSVNLYVMQWMNPWPERKISTIDFVSNNKGIPILIGLTVGRKDAVTAVVAGNRKESLRLCEEAELALQLKKYAEGEQILRQAVKADPSYENARLRLAEVLLLTGNEKGAEKELKETIQLFKNREAYWRLGCLYEDNNRLKNAKEILEEGLLVDPNQPRTFQTLERVQKKLTNSAP